MTHPKEGQIIAGKYRLDRPLSKGGMGAVWSATHTDLGMKVAVKLMEPHMAAHPEWRQRFAREAKAAGAIQSPHVVKVHDYGVDGDTPYLVMELLQGEDLGVRLRREHRLSLETTARIVLAIAKGLKRAHEAGVIHRDLKPANIFLTRADDDEIVQILDFGIARLTHGDPAEDRTETGVVLGSIRYMSPEQARGFKTADHRSDLWSLAVIAYRSLTGELPYDGVEAGDILVKLCTDPLPSAAEKLPTLAPALRRSLDQFFARALSRSPEERFQTARELADALCVLAGLEVEAPTTTSTPIASLPVGNNLVTNADTPIQDPTTTGTMPVPPPAPQAPSPPAPHLAEPTTADISATIDRTTKDDSPAPATSRKRTLKLAAGALAATAVGVALALGWSAMRAADPPLPGSNVSAAEDALNTSPPTGLSPASQPPTTAAPSSNPSESTAADASKDTPSAAPSTGPASTASASASTATSDSPAGSAASVASPPKASPSSPTVAGAGAKKPAGTAPSRTPQSSGDRVKATFGF